MGMAPDAFGLRRNLWLATTSAAFLASNFWIFIVAMSVLLLVARNKERNPLSLYFFLLFTVPPFAAALGGLGIVNQLFELSFPRLLSLLVLLPWTLKARDPDTPAFGKHLADWLLLSYLLLQLGSQLQIDTFTNTLRSGLYVCLDAVLPYYVASRALKTIDDFRDALLSFVIAVLMMVPIAAFEFLKHWLLYSALADALGMQWSGGSYLARGETLRAVVTAGHSIALGYVMMSAIMLHSGLRMAAARPRLWALGMAALGAGCIAALSRGPWVGVVAGLIVFAVASRQPGKGLLKFTLAVGVIVVAVSMSPWGAELIDYLPFVGNVDSNNVDYRKQLFDVSMLVIAQNPLFGSPMFMHNPNMQAMQNGNLIDVVNSYLLVALQSGGVGLSLFVGVFACAIWAVVAALRRQPDGHSERFLQGRALLAAMASILVTIATASNVGLIPIVYWCAAGLAIGYGRTSLSDVRDSRPEPSRLAMRIS
jgi:O-antigen ligase